MWPEDAVEPLHSDGEDGEAGASEGYLGYGEEPGNKQRVDLVNRYNSYNKQLRPHSIIEEQKQMTYSAPSSHLKLT